jgi:hypothetical protein
MLNNDAHIIVQTQTYILNKLQARSLLSDKDTDRINKTLSAFAVKFK